MRAYPHLYHLVHRLFQRFGRWRCGEEAAVVVVTDTLVHWMVGVDDLVDQFH